MLLNARQLGMETADLLERIGRAYYFLGDYNQAIKFSTSALEQQNREILRGTDVPVWRQVNTNVFLALSYWNINNQIKAVEYGCQAIDLNDGEPVNQGLPQTLILLCQESKP